MTDMEKQVSAAIAACMKENWGKHVNVWGETMPPLLAKAAMRAMYKIPESWFEGGNLTMCTMSSATWRAMLQEFSPPDESVEP